MDIASTRTRAGDVPPQYALSRSNRCTSPTHSNAKATSNAMKPHASVVLPHLHCRKSTAAQLLRVVTGWSVRVRWGFTQLYIEKVYATIHDATRPLFSAHARCWRWGRCCARQWTVRRPALLVEARQSRAQQEILSWQYVSSGVCRWLPDPTCRGFAFIQICSYNNPCAHAYSQLAGIGIHQIDSVRHRVAQESLHSVAVYYSSRCTVTLVAPTCRGYGFMGWSQETE